MFTPRDDPDYRHSDVNEELIADYEVECQFCLARRKLTEYTSSGWVVGDTIHPSSSDPSYGKCFRCSRYMLRVITTPVPPLLPTNTGFTKIPQK